MYFTAPIETNPCQPSPCGPNSQCKVVNGYSMCSCLSEYIGTPPTCRPECSIDSDCSPNRACSNQKCRDPCPGTCGENAQCHTISHRPHCKCPPGFTGNAFSRCYVQQCEIYLYNFVKTFFITPNLIYLVPPEPIQNPCVPSPCGPNSQCQVNGNSPSCSCVPTFIGSPPNCRPECISNSECSYNLACMNMKCKDPCPGSCAPNAECKVISHTPRCSCPLGYYGDPFTQCILQQGN